MHVLPPNATSSSVFDSMKIFMFESNNRRRKHQTDGIEKVVKNLSKGEELDLNFPKKP